MTCSTDRKNSNTHKNVSFGCAEDINKVAPSPRNACGSKRLGFYDNCSPVELGVDRVLDNERRNNIIPRSGSMDSKPTDSRWRGWAYLPNKKAITSSPALQLCTQSRMHRLVSATRTSVLMEGVAGYAFRPNKSDRKFNIFSFEKYFRGVCLFFNILLYIVLNFTVKSVII